MVDVAYLRTGIERCHEGVVILFQRHIKHIDVIACSNLYALEKGDVALDACDQDAVGRFCQAQLVKGTEPVGIAVEYVVLCHVASAA